MVHVHLLQLHVLSMHPCVMSSLVQGVHLNMDVLMDNPDALNHDPDTLDFHLVHFHLAHLHHLAAFLVYSVWVVYSLMQLLLLPLLDPLMVYYCHEVMDHRVCVVAHLLDDAQAFDSDPCHLEYLVEEV